MNRILLVDDDEHFLDGCRRGLRRQFDVTTAPHPDEALALLEQNDGFAVVVSDLRMATPRAGVEFLARVREQSPESVRIMLTGFADLASAIDAVNEGHVFRFLTKPCPPETLAQALQDGLRQFELTRSKGALIEARLSHAQKMEVVGQCAAGAVHDLRNILAVIHSCAELALSRQVTSDEGRGARAQGEVCQTLDTRHATRDTSTELLRDIQRAAENAAQLTGQLVGLARRQPEVAFRPLHLSGFLNTLAGLLRHVLARRIQVEVDCAPQLPLIAADESKLEQVILNLALNARDAMGGKGKLSLRAVPAEARDEGPETRDDRRGASASGPRPSTLDPRPWAGVCLSVADTGCGMDAGVKARIFEPFFTTKQPGAGTGLGLSVVAAIVREHRGWIEVDSAPGQGTRFNVFLPEWSAKFAAPRVETP